MMNQTWDYVLLVYVLTGVVILCVLFVLSAFLRAVLRRGAVPHIVLRECLISRDLRDGTYVSIVGRPEGFFSWLLSVIGLGDDIRFEVSKTVVRREVESSSRRKVDSVPLPAVSSTHFGSTKSFLSLVLGFLFMVIAVIAFVTSQLARENQVRDLALICCFVAVGIGLVLLLIYVLSKRLFIEVESSGGRLVGVGFKPSVLGRLHIDLEAAEEAVHIINTLVARYGAGSPSLAGSRHEQ